MTVTLTEKLDELCTQVAQMLNKDSVDADTPIAELGVDSLNIVEVILICEQIYPGVMNPENLVFDEHTTLREMDQQLLENSVEF
ncbi:acyl carrier protein [Bacterioplanes sanyensis]|uniref:Acyl carrier protein n=1 Tax=Bacterioplanes sanyensis TaxID=1249553 RepID=A0A222FGW7_9GAMM|nr:acyl carrier protein [Bacterioplanes sanyensis]ASP37681.1 acyl carrier protein [Bacterioplanes sanyensis]